MEMISVDSGLSLATGGLSWRCGSWLELPIRSLELQTHLRDLAVS